MILLVFSNLAQAQSCEIDGVKESLRKVLYLHFVEPSDNPLTLPEVVDLLAFYLSYRDDGTSTIDCSVTGARSNRKIAQILGQAADAPDRIPTCIDGTKFGKCSEDKPLHCTANSFQERCQKCGCPDDSICIKRTGQCKLTGKDVACASDIDCGTSGFVGDYQCSNNFVTKNFKNYTCVNPGSNTSSCAVDTYPVQVEYCDPALSKTCVDGKSNCETIVSEPPTNETGDITKPVISNVQVASITNNSAVIRWTTDERSYSQVEYGLSTEYGSFTPLSTSLITGYIQSMFGLQAASTYHFRALSTDASDNKAVSDDFTFTTKSGEPTIQEVITVKGRFVNKFTLEPLANARISSWPVTSQYHYTNENGEFSIDITGNQSQGIFTSFNSCYMWWGPSASLVKTADSTYVRLSLGFNPWGEAPPQFPVTGPEVDLGDIPFWPAVTIRTYADVPVQLSVFFPGTTNTVGNINYYTEQTLSQVFPLNYNFSVTLKENNFLKHTSPSINLGLDHGCNTKSLSFFDGQFTWEPYPIYIIPSWISPAQSGTVGSPYNLNFTTISVGGSLGLAFKDQSVAPYTWTIAYGALPAGLNLEPSTGVLSGTPTNAGLSTFTVKVKDGNGVSAGRALGLKINASTSTS